MIDWIRVARWGAVVAVCCAIATSEAAHAAEWRQFRGVDSTGVGAGDPPAKLDKVDWTAPLPGKGISGPIVSGERVIVTASSGYKQDRLHVIALDSATGAKEWERQFWATGRTQCHSQMAVATPTPASDGRRVLAFFSSNDLTCLDLDGKLLWYRGLTFDYPNASNSLGMSSSPVIVDDVGIVQLETDDDSFAMGVDMQTGAQRWKLDRPRGANWTSPLVVRGGGEQKLVLLQGSKGIAAVKPESGKVVWSYDEGAATIPSSTAGGRVVYIPSKGLTALDLSQPGKSPQKLWQVSQISPATPSPVFYDDRVYSITGAGILVAAEAKSGKMVWRLRLKGKGTTGSPIAAAGRLYLFFEDGLGQIVKLGEKSGEVISEKKFEPSILCTPAVCDDGVYVRNEKQVWKIGK